ncbi:acyltransferase family protein [Schlesneria sp.]|uniref:acyltransferase family protein n=1 Tax=Schlesneria sp. TaxID=2762018 RepID=UPI002F0A2A2B
MSLVTDKSETKSSSPARSEPAAAPDTVSVADAALATKRFVFVDGLRGLAAMGIVLFHIWWYEPPPYPWLDSIHWIVDATFIRIRAGVQVLLVISGFVIAYTCRKTWVTPREVSLFTLRRLIRLVPAYWFTLGCVVLVNLVCDAAGDFASPYEGELTIARVSAHLTFLQDILGHEALSAGIWTICIEMQFYVVAILGWGIAQHFFPRPVPSEPRPSAFALLAVFAPLGFASLFYWRMLESTTPWVIHFTWMFFLGMATWWTLDRSLPRFCYGIIVGIALVELAFDDEWWYENSVALLTSISIFVAGSFDRLHRWLNWPWLQYLGRISYSLYLIHFPVCHLVITMAWKLFDDQPTSNQASAILLSALGLSLVAAHALYTFVEAPSLRLSAILKRTAT